MAVTSKMLCTRAFRYRGARLSEGDEFTSIQRSDTAMLLKAGYAKKKGPGRPRKTKEDEEPAASAETEAEESAA